MMSVMVVNKRWTIEGRDYIYRFKKAQAKSHDSLELRRSRKCLEKLEKVYHKWDFLTLEADFPCHDCHIRSEKMPWKAKAVKRPTRSGLANTRSCKNALPNPRKKKAYEGDWSSNFSFEFRFYLGNATPLPWHGLARPTAQKHRHPAIYPITYWFNAQSMSPRGRPSTTSPMHACREYFARA